MPDKVKVTSWVPQGNKLNLCLAEFILGKRKCIYISTISHHWQYTGFWYPSLWKAMTCLFCKVYIKVADDLVMEGARASATIVLTLLIPVSATKRFHIEADDTLRLVAHICVSRADSRFAGSWWEMVLLCNDLSHWLGISHWLGANLESALHQWVIIG